MASQAPRVALPHRVSASTPLTHRLARGLVLVGLLGAPLVGFLLSSPARPPIKTPLFPRGSGWPGAPVPLSPAAGSRGEVAHRISLFSPAPGRLLEHPEIWIPMAPRANPPRLIRGQLRLLGTSCVYETGEGARLRRDEALVLLRRPGCLASAAAATGELHLELRVRGDGDLALSALMPPAATSEPEYIYVPPAIAARDAIRPVLRCFGVEYPRQTGLRRVDLLNHMWQLSPQARWLWLLLGVACLLALAGCVVFPWQPLPDRGGPSAGRFVLAAAGGAFCFSAALGLLYATLAPPLSGPDEPYHLLAYAALGGDTRVSRETVSWIQLTHLQRIRFHPTERFRPQDVGAPDTVEEDPQVGVPEVRRRSATSSALWRTVGPRLRGGSAARTLLCLRMLNALLFSLAVGVATAFAVACSTAPCPQLLCLPFLLPPALTFFATSFSDVALTCAAYVLLASSLVVTFLDGPRAHWMGLPLGLSCGLMLAGGRSAWPLAVVPAVVLVAHVLAGSRQGGFRPTVVFWTTFAIGGSGYYLLTDDTYHAGVAWERVGSVAPGGLGAAATWMSDHPSMMLMLVALAALLEASLGGARQAVVRAVAPSARRAIRPVTLFLAVLIALSLAASLFVDYPGLRPIIVPNPLSAREYVTEVVAAMLTSFRMTPPDFLLVSLFWGGFGWFDAVPSPVLLTGLSVATGVSSIGLLLWLARNPDLRRTTWLLTLGVGWIAALVLYALAIHAVRVMNVTGRYMAGWHLCVLAVLWAWPALAGGPRGEPSWRSRASLWCAPRVGFLLTAAAVIHTYCLCFILWRYF